MKGKKWIIPVMLLVYAVTGIYAGGSKEDSKAAEPAEQREKIVWLHWANDPQQTAITAVVKAFEEKYPIDIVFDLRPGSAEGENLVKTRLAANDMPDMLSYNSGSLFQVLNLEKNFVDLSGEAFSDRILESFKTTVSTGGDAFYGIPIQPIATGGIVYNKEIYASLGLNVPRTWSEFMKNCEKIKAAGIVPVIMSYRDDWTSQLLLLTDYYNLQAQVPDFAENYTANKAKFASTPAALRGFEKIQEVFTKGYINSEPMATTYDMAQEMLVKGEGAHYVMPTWVLSSINANYPEHINNIGFFANPSDSAGINGVTLWMPNNISISSTSKKIEAAKKFLDFYVSDEGLAAYMSVGAPDGAFAIKDVELPDDVFPAVRDVLEYINSDRTAPALEFVSPVKGPNLPQICIQAGLALKTPKECAAEYDRDVEKQAKQLMLPGW